jgi:flavin reductase (DIM6/NTAB) family NADH-FMN oxidoreductase RutF
MSPDDEDLHTLVGGLDPPMLIVTAASGSRRGGCLVGFSTQCSIDPTRFLVCLSKRNATYRIAQDAPVLAVHVLTTADRAVSELFGEQTGDDTDKLQHVDWQPGPHGVPVLDAGAGCYIGTVLDRSDVGDHVAFLVEPVEVRLRGWSAPQLGFQAVKDMEPGHEA